MGKFEIWEVHRASVRPSHLIKENLSWEEASQLYDKLEEENPSVCFKIAPEGAVYRDEEGFLQFSDYAI